MGEICSSTRGNFSWGIGVQVGNYKGVATWVPGAEPPGRRRFQKYFLKSMKKCNFYANIFDFLIIFNENFAIDKIFLKIPSNFSQKFGQTLRKVKRYAFVGCSGGGATSEASEIINF